MGYTYEEYVALEEASPTRHEYWQGEIYAMAGGTPDHAALAAALIGALHGALRGDCRAHSSDLRVYIAETELTTYPDVTVVCGPSERAAKDRFAITNPRVLVEATSPATEDYDRGEKLRQYKTLPSVDTILIVSHRSPRVTVHRREGDTWHSADVHAGDAIELSCTDEPLDVDALYARGLEDV